MYGWECLTVDLDGYCSRRMPIHSGSGLPEFVEVERGRVLLRFDPVLAAKLELARDVEIVFDVTDDDFRKLCKTINYLQGD
jgi:hypothetical protein